MRKSGHRGPPGQPPSGRRSWLIRLLSLCWDGGDRPSFSSASCFSWWRGSAGFSLSVPTDLRTESAGAGVSALTLASSAA